MNSKVLGGEGEKRRRRGPVELSMGGIRFKGISFSFEKGRRGDAHILFGQSRSGLGEREKLGERRA